ncbi:MULTISPECIES: PTS glucose transporter subunit IIA [unclassified Paenibacillus]|uniref:PTS sugar transporter subunit IIA n=1 Tax=unclassified Paenibacillus TaxID=185978 RepID=UPI001C0FB65E|nr:MULTISPECIES: PTS glucose transporter subunit IIA [unclassified Paenibacillus]MBU5440879.1 PTS glucose transporter subunit IIA [Paenibacillus sp. MSJ-34]CAH0118421.1 PTS system glucose-specific EIIA component [Paenibacillus sp. CECT 9249]
MIFKKKKVVTLIPPLSGISVALEEVPDPAFAQGFIGEGIAVKPTNGQVVAPCDGKVSYMFDTHHSCIIEHESGVEVLIHIGINTVQLRGEGFRPYVKSGERVKQGQLLIEFDIERIEQAGYPVITAVVMANGDAVEKVTSYRGEVTANVGVLLEIQVK